MTLSISNGSKNILSITNNEKDPGTTWNDMMMTWTDAEGSWDVPNPLTITKDSKNSLSISNETKN